ncbi:MAG: DUF1579 family protein [Candidatus Eisenbacteria bacterium]|uniref:DUF1579 family protein n=1 Tax=Eiseniibacteriota bacterium TaxID=2212470 RepID=A0A956LWG1_UNCEI|nr:DUF1579 family protein [Candidatus Eisenbacteria bacterium]
MSNPDPTERKNSPADPTIPEEFLSALMKWRAVREPGPAHVLLPTLVGTWDVQVRFHGGAEAYESAATATKRLAHGGRFLFEDLQGEIQAPDETGRMRPEPYSVTRTLGYDRCKNAWVGTFLENQNTSLISIVGAVPVPEAPPAGSPYELSLYGHCDEPMLDLHDTVIRWDLRIESATRHTWELFAMAAGGRKVFDFVYERAGD